MKLRFLGLWGPLFAAAFVIALVPATALADANPNNHGNHYHYGWTNHQTPPPPAPAPKPSGGGTTTGVQNTVAVVIPPAVVPEAPTAVPPDLPVIVPPGSIIPAAQPLAPGRNLWLVVIILAAVLAANVTLAVIATGRGGHYAIRRLAPVGIRI